MKESVINDLALQYPTVNSEIVTLILQTEREKIGEKIERLCSIHKIPEKGELLVVARQTMVPWEPKLNVDLTKLWDVNGKLWKDKELIVSHFGLFIDAVMLGDLTFGEKLEGIVDNLRAALVKAYCSWYYDMTCREFLDAINAGQLYPIPGTPKERGSVKTASCFVVYSGLPDYLGEEISEVPAQTLRQFEAASVRRQNSVINKNIKNYFGMPM